MVKKDNSKIELFRQCPLCEKSVDNNELKTNLYVCPQCGYHFKLSAYNRLEMLFDSGNYKELFKNISGKNPINFPKYDEKLKEQKEKTGMNEAAVAAVGKIDGMKAVAAVLDSRFLMGSMGTAVGEKITLAIEYAIL